MQPEPDHLSVTASGIDTFTEDRSAVLALIGGFVDAVDRDVDAAVTDDIAEYRRWRVKAGARPLPDAADPMTGCQATR